MKYFKPRFSLLAVWLAMVYGITIMCLRENQWWLLTIIAVTSGLLFGLDAILCSKQADQPYESMAISAIKPEPVRIPPDKFLN